MFVQKNIRFQNEDEMKVVLEMKSLRSHKTNAIICPKTLNTIFKCQSDNRKLVHIRA